jgi:hypothetical protein
MAALAGCATSRDESASGIAPGFVRDREGNIVAYRSPVPPPPGFPSGEDVAFDWIQANKKGEITGWKVVGQPAVYPSKAEPK